MDHSNIEQYCLVSTFITISLEENIDIFKKKNGKYQTPTFNDLFKSYNVLTDNIQVDPPFTLLRVIKKQIKLQYMAQFYYFL